MNQKTKGITFSILLVIVVEINRTVQLQMASEKLLWIGIDKYDAWELGH